MKILRHIRRIIELPFLEIKWFITKRFRIGGITGRNAKNVVVMTEKLHMISLEAERLERPEVHMRAVGALMALQWWCGDMEDIDVEN